jgi:hypothetical protein
VPDHQCPLVIRQQVMGHVVDESSHCEVLAGVMPNAVPPFGVIAERVADPFTNQCEKRILRRLYELRPIREPSRKQQGEDASRDNEISLAVIPVIVLSFYEIEKVFIFGIKKLLAATDGVSEVDTASSAVGEALSKLDGFFFSKKKEWMHF